MMDVVDPRRFAHVRWVGTLAVVAGFVAITGTVMVSIGYFGTGSVRSVWLELLPWIVIILFGFLARFLRGQRATGAAIGLAVIGVLVAGPSIIGNLARLRWLNDADLWPVAAGTPTDISPTTAEWLLAVGLLLIVIASIMVAISSWIPVSRSALIPGIRIPRSPYRIEVLALLFVFVIVAVATASDAWSSFGTYSTFTKTALLLSWLIPLTLVLGFTLRSSGMGSLWAVAALGIAVIAEPAARSLALSVWSGLGWTNAEDWWYQEQAWAMGRGLAPGLASATLILPVIVLIAVVILWNAQPAAIDGPYVRTTPASAPLDPWAGVAFVLAFIPLIALPALILGHISYERIAASDRPVRGRVLAATAITIGIVSVTALALFITGDITSLDDVWILGWLS